MRGVLPKVRSPLMGRAMRQDATLAVIPIFAKDGCHPIHRAGMAIIGMRFRCSRLVRALKTSARHPDALR